jgi:hypothetical protein
MAWKSIELSKNVSQKKCKEFLDDENFEKTWTFFWVQKTCANGAITLKLYPYEGVNLEDAEKDAGAFITWLHLNFLHVVNHDIFI